MEPKTSKQIVSKGVYVAVQGKRMAFRLFGISFYGLTLFSALLTTGYVIILFILILGGGSILGGKQLNGEEWVIAIFIYAVASSIAGGVFCLFRKLSKYAMMRVAQLDAIVPLTRANFANLPAPKSLVRASSEPIQAQEAVLLRAAAEGQATPPEQLVRASSGEE